MEQYIKDHYINRIENSGQSTPNKMKPLIEQLKMEYKLKSIPIAHFFNGILNLLFPADNYSTMHELYGRFHVMLYVIVKATCDEENIDPDKKQMMDFILISIYNIDKTKTLSEFTKVFSEVTSNTLFNNQSTETTLISYSRVYFDMFFQDELYFSDPIRACKIASGESLLWKEYLDCYHPDVLKKSLSYI
jgi:hypothetical protein